MSGGWPSQAGKRAGWRGPEPLFLRATTRPAVFRPLFFRRGCLEGLGVANPLLKKRPQAPSFNQSRRAYQPQRSAGHSPAPRPEKGQPRERQHSAPSSAKSGIDCPRRGVPNLLARRIEARRAETRNPRVRDPRGSAGKSLVGEAGRACRMTSLCTRIEVRYLTHASRSKIVRHAFTGWTNCDARCDPS